MEYTLTDRLYVAKSLPYANKSMFKNNECHTNNCLLRFKYYICKDCGLGVLVCADKADAGGWGPRFWEMR